MNSIFSKRPADKSVIRSQVLILKADHLGDFALALPTLWELVNFSGAGERLHLLVHPANLEWANILPWLPAMEALKHPRYPWNEALLPLHWSTIQQLWKLRARPFGRGINLMSAQGDRWSNRLLRLAGTKTMPPKVPAGPRTTNNELSTGPHEVRQIAARVPKDWGVQGITEPAVFMPSDLRWQGGDQILLAPAARTAAKSWPVENWRALLRALPPATTKVLIPSDEIGAKIRSWVPADQQLVVASIGETLRVLQQSSVLVALDTAMGHYAWLVGTPIVQLFAGSADSGRWGSLAPGKILDLKVRCAPCKQEQCYQPLHLCMDGISVTTVLKALDEVMGAPPPQLRGDEFGEKG